jgi:hypothetical protein
MQVLIANIDNEILENVYLTLNRYLPDWEILSTGYGKQCLDTINSNNCPDILILGRNYPIAQD